MPPLRPDDDLQDHRRHHGEGGPAEDLPRGTAAEGGELGGGDRAEVHDFMDPGMRLVAEVVDIASAHVFDARRDRSRAPK